MCQRVMTDVLSLSTMSLASCQMTCSPGRNIWPKPTGEVRIANTTASFHPRILKIDFEPVSNLDLALLLKKAAKRYQERISNLAQKSHTHATVTAVNIDINVKAKKFEYFNINIDESYKLIIAQKGLVLNAIILASSFLGAHHGLETLTQLVWWDDKDHVLKIMNNVVISDSPIFTYRGLMVDTSNHFIPVPSILDTIEAMSLSKMNVFHWHMTGSKSFPLVSKRFPMFSSSGSYSDKEVYTIEDIHGVVRFSEERGVSVLVEIDAPAHNSQGWGWGVSEDKGNLSLCLDAQPFYEFCAQPPCGQLNPINENTYSVLVQLLKELKESTRSGSLLHLGGDEVDFRCWETSEEVTDSDIYMKKGILGIWEHFYRTLLSRMKKEEVNTKNAILWSNDFLEESKFWKNVKQVNPIIQSKGPATSGELERLVKKKFRVIVSSSDAWDLSEAQPWRVAYHHHPWSDLSQADRRLVLGGEALVFTDLLDRHSLHPAVWPAAAAVAERLWTDPSSSANPMDRLAVFTERMRELGVRSSPVAPQWCLLNPYQCL